METVQSLLLLVGVITAALLLGVWVVWPLDALGNIKSRVENIDKGQDDLLEEIAKIKQKLEIKDED